MHILRHKRDFLGELLWYVAAGKCEKICTPSGGRAWHPHLGGYDAEFFDGDGDDRRRFCSEPAQMVSHPDGWCFVFTTSIPASDL